MEPSDGDWEEQDFWGPYVRVSLHFESCSRKALEKQYLFRGSLCFQLVFLSRARDFTTFTLYDLTDLYIEKTALQWITEHSCLHSRWPNSKTKLKWNHLREQGGPLVFLCIGRIGSALRPSKMCIMFIFSDLEKWILWDELVSSVQIAEKSITLIYK